MFLALLLAFSLTFAWVPAPAKAAGTAIPGIDVSTHNKSIDWNAVKNSGIQFAMIRDGYGGDPDSWDSQEDAYFESNYSGATAAGIKVGVYHYSYATSVSMASDEAGECLHILNNRHLDYPVAYDVEDPSQYGLSSDTLGQIVQTFCEKIKQAGYNVVVYSSKSFLQDHLNSHLLDPYDIWVAQWGSSTDFSSYTMWQYSSAGSVPGISGRCDMDYSYVDYANGQTGHGSGQQLDPLTFICDTSSYTFSTNRTYTYRITTPDTYPPTATSSNPSAVTVSGPTPTYQGYYFTLTNVGPGDATITTTAGDGRSVSFTATGNGKGSSLRCDTASYAFTPNITSYFYKITTDSSTAPTAVSSNTSVVTVAYSQKTTGGYLYKITNVGAGSATVTTTAADGSSASFPVTGIAAAAPAALRCDTPSYSFAPGRTSYIYKITTDSSSAPTAVSSDTSVVTVAYSQKTSGGYLYKIANVGAGHATITTTASNGASVSFPVTGMAVSTALQCDTSSYTFGPGRYVYTYKITTDASSAPTARSSDTSVATVSYLQKTTGGYLYKITNVGAGNATITTTAANGTSASFPVTGIKPGDALSILKSDTPYNYSMKKGAYYTYKFTGDPNASYIFTSGNGSFMRIVSAQKSNGSVYVKIYAVGNGQVGIYAAAGGTPQRQGIITIS